LSREALREGRLFFLGAFPGLAMMGFQQGAADILLLDQRMTP